MDLEIGKNAEKDDDNYPDVKIDQPVRVGRSSG
jgi:hypothetical protein